MLHRYFELKNLFSFIRFIAKRITILLKIGGNSNLNGLKHVFWKIDLSKPPLGFAFVDIKKITKLIKNASIGHVSQKLWPF